MTWQAVGDAEVRRLALERLARDMEDVGMRPRDFA